MVGQKNPDAPWKDTPHFQHVHPSVGLSNDCSFNSSVRSESRATVSTGPEPIIMTSYIFILDLYGSKYQDLP